jgi:hypothetical protein
MPEVIKNGKKVKLPYTKKGKATARKLRKSINKKKGTGTGGGY